MRKIERQIVEKMNLWVDVRKLQGYFQNTYEQLSVRDAIVYNQRRDAVEYVLHTSKIFSYYVTKDVIRFTFDNWDTLTTKQRLNVLLSFFCNVIVYKNQHKLYCQDINGNETCIDPSKVYEINCNNGKITEVDSLEVDSL